MYLLESPLEALAFRYSTALASSAWAWLAILFAAVLSFWRIRSIGSPPKAHQQPEPSLKVSATVPKLQDSVSTLPVSCYHVDGGEWSGTKGRFTAYFHMEGDGDIVSEEGYCDGVSDEDERPLVKCEDLRGDLGWYRYLNLTAFDGNVVRLWDRNEGLRQRV